MERGRSVGRSPLPNSCNHAAPSTDRESGLNRRLVYGATRLGSSVVTTAFQILLITLAVKRLGIDRISNTSCLRGACFESIRDTSTSDERVDRVVRHAPRSAHDHRSCVPGKRISQWISRQEERSHRGRNRCAFECNGEKKPRTRDKDRRSRLAEEEKIRGARKLKPSLGSLRDPAGTVCTISLGPTGRHGEPKGTAGTEGEG